MSGVLITAAGDGRYVFNVEGIEPPARFGATDFDTGQWVTIRVKESEHYSGPWGDDGNVIGSASLPVEADPADPSKLNVTVAGANLLVGWYVFELLDTDGNVQPLAPIHSGQSWRPGTKDVARRLRARLYAQGGRIDGFLNEDDDDGPTDPTRDEVERLVDDAMSDIASEVAVQIPQATYSVARRVAALGAAMLIELGSEDFDQERYDRLKDEYDRKLPKLVDNAQDTATGGEVGDGDDRMQAAGSFGSGSGCVEGSEHSWAVIGKNGIEDIFSC